MRSYTIKKIEHFVYEDLDEIPKDLVYLKEWREGEVGDWVLADDGCVIQVLRKNALAKHTKKVQFDYTIGTCTGTFAVRPTVKMDTERREDIYSLSGKIAAKRVKGDKNLTKNEILFSQLLARGVSADEAYLKVYRTNNRKYAKLQAGILVKSERIKKAMKEELKPVLAALGITPELVLENVRDIATSGEKESDRLKALFELGEILELKETNKVTEVTGALFQGFQPEQIKASVRPQLKE
tara:strand:+ start:343 stop:1062 length:720 start_codon:yes stop_codon:yes gene_type:complete